MKHVFLTDVVMGILLDREIQIQRQHSLVRYTPCGYTMHVRSTIVHRHTTREGTFEDSKISTPHVLHSLETPRDKTV